MESGKPFLEFTELNLKDPDGYYTDANVWFISVLLPANRNNRQANKDNGRLKGI